jgi:hypothetical protein
MATIRNQLPHSARRHDRNGADGRAIVITVAAHVALVLALLATPTWPVCKAASTCSLLSTPMDA